MQLTFDAVDNRGQRFHDVVDAPSERQALEQLRGRGLFVTQLSRSPEDHAAVRGPRPSFVPRLPLGVLVLFTRQMAMLLRAGSGVVPAIAAIRRQMKKRAHTELLDRLCRDLEEGQPLTDAMRKHPSTFDAVYCAIIAAGEASASMAGMFDRLAGIVSKRRSMRNKILGSMAYPALLIGLCTKIVLVLLFFVLPRFAGMFKQLGVETPSTTRFLLSLGEGLRNHWAILAASLVGAIGAAIWTLRSPRGKQWLSDAQLRIPVLGRLRGRLIQAQVFRTLGMLIESRVGLLEAFELTRSSTRNRQFQSFFAAMEHAVTSGAPLSSALETSSLVEPYVYQAVRTGEESGNLGEAMTFSADILDETNTELVNVVSKLIEPVILISMGLVVGFVAVSLFLPLFDLTSAIQ